MSEFSLFYSGVVDLILEENKKPGGGRMEAMAGGGG